jgi:hypothetical protein
MPAQAVSRYWRTFPTSHFISLLPSFCCHYYGLITLSVGFLTNNYAFYSLVSLGLVDESGQEKVIYYKDMWNEKVCSSLPKQNRWEALDDLNPAMKKLTGIGRITHIRGWDSFLRS